MKAPLLIPFWYKALEAEFGFVLPVNKADLEYWKHELYAARKLANDEALQQIVVCLPAGLNEIWLVKKTVEMEL